MTADGLGSLALAWRLALMAGGTVALLLGTAIGSDAQWPFGSMGQFAFSVPADGQVHSPGVEADTVDGATVRVPLSPGGVGVRRAEIEAQMFRIAADPAQLQGLAVLAAARHPEWPRYRTLRLVDDITHLADGRVSRRSHQVLATWTVVNPEDPESPTRVGAP